MLARIYFNLIKPGILFVEHRQTVHTQNRFSIHFSGISFQNETKVKNIPDTPKNTKILLQHICVHLICWKTLHAETNIFKQSTKNYYNTDMKVHNNWAVTHDFQQCGILTSVDSEEPVQPPFKLRNSIWFCLFLLLYVPSQQLWSLRDGQFT